MKANEVPERLYLLPNGLISYCRNTDEDVEYTRTDAFIDKSATWFANRYQSNGSYLCAEDIEDFIKTMKGE